MMRNKKSVLINIFVILALTVSSFFMMGSYDKNCNGTITYSEIKFDYDNDEINEDEYGNAVVEAVYGTAEDVPFQVNITMQSGYLFNNVYDSSTAQIYLVGSVPGISLSEQTDIDITVTDAVYAAMSANVQLSDSLAVGNYTILVNFQILRESVDSDAGGNVSFSSTLTVNVIEADQAAPEGVVGIAPTSAANNDGKITGVTAAMEYKLSTASVYTEIAGTEITGLQPGTYHVRFAAKEGFNAGTTATVTVPAYVAPNQDQAAPEGLVGIAPTSGANNDGKITGVTAAMEYKLSTASDYTPIAGIEITNLQPGTYHVRLAAKEGFNAGTAATVTVPAYASQGGGNTSDRPEPNKIIITIKDDTVTSSTSITGVSSGSDVKASVPVSTINELVNRSVAAGTAGNNSVINLNVDTGKNADSLSVVIPANSIRKIANDTDAALSVSSGLGSLTFDNKAVESISQAAGSAEVNISIKTVDKSALTAEVQEQVGDRPVYDFSVITDTR